MEEYEKTNLCTMTAAETEWQCEAFRRSQRNLKQITASLPWPMCVIRPDDGMVLYANEAFRAYFLLPAETAGGGGMLWSILPAVQADGRSSHEHLKQFMARILAGGAADNAFSLTVEQEYILASGETALMRVVGCEIDYEDRSYISMAMQDISALKRERELLQSLADKEREANELKSKFIINMSHEIRTPMNGIIGLADIQLQKTYDRENRAAFKKISLSAKLLLAIVNDILDYSKIEAGNLTIDYGEFVLENIVYEAMQTAGERLGDKKVEMLLQMDGQIPRKVVGDSVRVWQILQNILDNSAKYTDRGSIILEISKAAAAGNQKSVLLFRIADTGRGMNREQLEKAYEPFEQFGGSNWKNSGTGLGLPVTKQLVELMGGTIMMSSCAGEGTVTELRIPFGVSEWDEPAIEQTAYRILKDKRILIADENELGARVMCALLQAIGAGVERITDFTAVPAQIAGHSLDKYDIIVADHRLNKELLKSLRGINFNKTKLITVEKPYKPTQVLERLSALLGGASSTYKIKNKKYHFPQARVLICEDNEINQDVIMGVMELYDIKAVTASNGAEGIKWLEKEVFDLVIMDILMPVMDGHEATRAIRQSGKSYAAVPIIAMTANAMDEEMTVCLDDGMNGYITKPVELERLYHEFLKWLPVSTREEADEPSVRQSFHDTEQEEVINDQKFRFEQLGIDVEEATKRFGGKYELYCKSLRKFAAEMVVNKMMDSAAAAEAEPDELRKYIHSLKGVTANLSIKEDNRLLVMMEQTIKAGEPDIGLYQLLSQHMLRTSKGIMLLLGREEEKKLAAGSWDECKELLDGLKQLLLLAKAKECEQQIEQIRAKEWDNVDAELLDKICTAVENYDYNNAMTIIGQLL